MNIGQFLSALLELVLIIIHTLLCLALVCLLGWWLPIHNGLTDVIERIPEKFQWIVFPVSFVLLFFMPFYALASVGIVGLKHSKGRLSVIYQDISDSFK